MAAPTALACRLVVLGAVTLAGCGGDDSKPADAALSKSEYEAAFRAAFERAQSQPAGETEEDDESASAQARELTQGFHVMRAMAAELAKLRPPAEVREAHRLFVMGLRG